VDAGGMGMSPERYHAVFDTWRNGQLPIRVRTLHGAVTSGLEQEEMAAWCRYLHPAAGDGLLAVLGAGEAIHYGCHDWEGMGELSTRDEAWQELAAIVEQCAAQGWPLTVHAILDESVDRVLTVFEEVNERWSLRDLRFSLCHVECISARNLERARALGLGLAVQGRMAQKAQVTAQHWGREALLSAPPLGDIARMGIPFGAGTDGTRSASYDPWLTIWWLVTGKVLDGGPERSEAHRLSREAALRAYSVGSTWFSFEESIRGELLPGRLADFAVLDRDIFDIPSDDIPNLASDMTVVDGRVVHVAGAFDGMGVENHPPRPGASQWAVG
jgi:predicted amidohydrolase YtcJ